MDYKTEVFEAIRRKDAVVWIGAGFSIYGGYSTGAGLSEQLYNKLTEEERDGLNKYDLQAVSQAYVDFQKPNIFDHLKSEFHKKSKNNHYHLKLAKIPHINTIITTNYDRMLEEAYDVNCQLIYKDDQISSIDNNKIQVLKIHGDLQDENSIVLTKDHYTKFFNGKNNSNLWTVIKERFITKNQIFIGYGLEDINVNSFIEDMWSKSENRKECFFIAPKIPNHKIANLKNKGIKYINLTGEQFVTALDLNINENILKDFRGQKIDSDTFNTFMSKHKMYPNLSSNGSNLEVKSIKLSNEGVGKMTFSLDEETAIKFEKIYNGESFEPIKIQSDIASLMFEDVNLLNYEKGGIIEFKKPPALDGKCDIEVKNQSLEITDVKYKLFLSDVLLQIDLELKCGKIKFKMSYNTVKKDSLVQTTIEILHNDNFKNTKDEFEFYNLLYHIYKGETMQLYLQNGETHSLTNNSKQQSQDFLNNTLFYLDHINNLKIIEKNYGIKFKDFKLDSITSETKKVARLVKNSIEREFTEIIVDYEFQLFVNDLTLELIEIIRIGNMKDVQVVERELTKQYIHDMEIEVGYAKVIFDNLIAINNNELMEGSNKQVTFRSDNGRARIIYLKSLPNDLVFD